MKKAIITGITGQDGAYLTKLLLEKGYQVFGTYRRTSSVNFWRLEELGVAQHKNLELVEYDLTDEGAAMRMISSIVPDEVYNLAAQSFVTVSFEQPITTAQITGVGCLNLLEAIRTINPKVKYYQASTSELYGKVTEVPQNEKTPFYPRSPYAVSKLFAHWMTVNYRESYGLFACSGILFNHESPLRGIEFVTRKITDVVAKYKQNGSEVLELGNIDAKRDWGYAQDYVEGMYLMLQQSDPIDCVLATGNTYSVRDFVELAFAEIGVNIRWQGKDLAEQGVDDSTGHVVVKINPKFYRPTEVDLLIGDPALAKSKLGWTSKTNLKDLCSMMVRRDIERIQSS
ncbi:GDP-mannose 4,6-dehydratase [bacterium]|nr:GDP-mannose 4,6-dehydratase [bacterium]